jgi:hypothetical protein
MSFFPKEKNKIRARIRQYERSLLAEESKFDGISDGAGKRYSLGPLYLLADDLDGALKAFQWFKRKFPNDIGEPFHYLCWTLALLKSGDIAKAKQKLLETVFSNQYIIPFLLERNIDRFDMWHSSNVEEPEWIKEGPIELFDLWDEESIAWLTKFYDNPDFEKTRKRQIELNKLLESESSVEKRRKLLDEIRKLRKSDLAEI